MVVPHAVHDRRIHIVDMDRVANDVVSVVVRFPMHDSRLDATPRHPDRKAAPVMVAAVVILQATLPVDCSTELTSQTISVSSSSPRCFRSLIRAA